MGNISDSHIIFARSALAYAFPIYFVESSTRWFVKCVSDASTRGPSATMIYRPDDSWNFEFAEPAKWIHSPRRARKIVANSCISSATSASIFFSVCFVTAAIFFLFPFVLSGRLWRIVCASAIIQPTADLFLLLWVSWKLWVISLSYQ